MVFVGFALGLAIGALLGYARAKGVNQKPKSQPVTWEQMMAHATRLPKNDPELASDVERDIEMQFKEL